MKRLTLLVAFALGMGAEPPPCAPREPGRCMSCHEKNLAEVFPARAPRPCVPYCLSCHFEAKPERHHPVGQEMRKVPQLKELQLTGNRLTCATCHDVSRPPVDNRRWKAASFFERLFRPQAQHRTYFLVSPNDRGQLCQACH